MGPVRLFVDCDQVTSCEESQPSMLFAFVPFRQLASYERADGGVMTGTTGEKYSRFQRISLL